MILFLGGIDYSADEVDLREHFHSVGVALNEISIIREKESRKSRGFGFIDVVDSQVADALSLNGVSLKGRKLGVQIARGRKS